jgi:hypothetical protein
VQRYRIHTHQLSKVMCSELGYWQGFLRVTDRRLKLHRAQNLQPDKAM